MENVTWNEKTDKEWKGDFSGDLVVETLPCGAGDVGSIMVRELTPHLLQLRPEAAT